MSGSSSISAEFPFKSRYVEKEGSRIHCIEEGAGEPVLFLKGNPRLFSPLEEYHSPLIACGPVLRCGSNRQATCAMVKRA
jgi:hypothetical protein